jgi:hypothetical protein
VEHVHGAEKHWLRPGCITQQTSIQPNYRVRDVIVFQHKTSPILILRIEPDIDGPAPGFLRSSIRPDGVLRREGSGIRFARGKDDVVGRFAEYSEIDVRVRKEKRKLGEPSWRQEEAFSKEIKKRQRRDVATTAYKGKKFNSTSAPM